MAAQGRQAKVLRIGIIQDGKIVQERLIKAGESVTVGESPKNTFVFPKTHLPGGEFVLFRASGKGYVLQFTDRMRGKISSGGAVVALQKLSTEPSVTKKNNIAQLPLTDQDRGKIAVDSVTVLFQFVPPPPLGASKAIQQMDFRPRFIEDDDPVFIGFLGIWAALAFVFSIWVLRSEPHEYTLEELPDRFVKMIVPEQPEEKQPDLVIDDQAAEAEKEVESEKPAEGPKGEVTEAQKAKAEAERKDELISQSKLLLKIIGTRGESSNGLVENLWSDEEQGLGDIDKALQESGGVTSDPKDAGLRSGNEGGNEAAAGGDVNGVGGERIGGVAGPAVVMKAKVYGGTGEIDATGDEGQVKATVQRYQGQLQYCYEKQLKVSPSLEGRVEIGWSVSSGLVSSGPYIVANTTGDAELADCVIKKIRRWEFPPDVSGEMSWPFVFTQKT
jgi:hypothetical protein